MDIENYQRLGLHERSTRREVNGRSNAELMNALNTEPDEHYLPCPESEPVNGVPTGEVKSYPAWPGAKTFPGTTRDLWIYIPDQFDPAGEAPGLIVFNDGAGYLAREGSVRAPAVLDTLIHNGELPPTIGVFIMPGVLPDPEGRAQRSFEYDSLTPLYVDCLLDDVLPFVEAEIGASLNQDPGLRTIVGISSGGICAFNAAWHRPDVFGKVISHCGSFVNINGGHNYPYLIRSTDRKPIKVFLTSGELDGDIIIGNWPLANKQMAAALDFAGYEHRFEFGEGGHSLAHGGSMFAETLRWLQPAF